MAYPRTLLLATVAAVELAGGIGAGEILSSGRLTPDDRAIVCSRTFFAVVLVLTTSAVVLIRRACSRRA